MAYTKIHAIKTTVGKAIDYICNESKTDEKIYISSFACSPETAAIDFKYTLDHCRESSVNKAYHLIQAFHPDEVSFDEAHVIGQELADKLLEGKYSYVVTTHIDKGHVHNHIIFCAADNIDHNKYHDCKRSYYQIRSLSDDLCQKHNLSIIVPSPKRGSKYIEWSADQINISWKTQIRKDINQSIKSSYNFDEFLILMKSRGYEIKDGKYLSFRPADKERFVRGSDKSLGAEYTKERIQERIINREMHQPTETKATKGIRKLVNVQKDINNQETLGLQRWVAKENLKISAQTYNEMQSKDIHSLSELTSKISSLKEKVNAANEGVIQIEKRLKELGEIMKYVDQYQINLPFHENYLKAKNKDSVFQKYESQIILFGGAEGMLKRYKIDVNSANLNGLKKEYETLVLEQKMKASEINSVRQELKGLELIGGNIESYLRKETEKRTSSGLYGSVNKGKVPNER